MKKTLFALMLGAVMVSTAVAAAPYQYDDHHDQHDQDRDHDRDHGREHDHDHDGDHDRRDWDHGHDHDRDHREYVIVHDRGNHEGWYHRGGYVPAEYYRDQRYYVDYRVYHLAPPPPEHVWVRSDTGDFLLVAVASGIIADLVINH